MPLTADITFTEFDGNALNGSSAYKVYVYRDNAWSRSVSPQWVERRNSSPLLESIRHNPLEIVLRIEPADDSVAYATWKTNVSQWFQPWESDELRTLKATFEDASGTTVQIDVIVQSLTKTRDAGAITLGDLAAVRYEAVVVAPDPTWYQSASTLESDSFTGANNDPLGADWTTDHLDTSDTSIQSNALRMRSQGAAYSAARALHTGMAAVADCRVDVKLTLAADGEQYAIVSVRHSGTWDGTDVMPQDGYTLSVEDDGANELLYLAKNVSGARTTLASLTINYAAGTQYNLAIMAVGSTIAGKMWAVGSAEPDYWQLAATDTAHTSGKVGLSLSNDTGATSRTATWDDFQITTIGESLDLASTVTNAGTTPTPGILDLTTSTHMKLYACTVQGVGAGGGLLGYPVRVAYTESGLTAGEVFAYSPGNIPTLSDDYNAYIWTLVNTSGDANVSTALDVVCANGIADANTAGGDLNDGGMKLLDAVSGTDSSNSTWSWNDLTVSLNADRCGSWRPGLTGTFQTVGTYNITSEGSSLTITIGPGGNGERVADSITCVLGCTGSSVANLSRATTVGSGSGTSLPRAYFMGRTYGQSTWTVIWSVTTTTTVTTSITVTGYTELACGIEHQGSPTTANHTLVLSGAGTGGIFTCSLANTPTVTVPASTNLDYYDGAFENDTNGDEIDFESFMVRDGTLTVDTANGTIESSTGLYRSYGKIEFNNPDCMFLLDPGANAITNGIGGSPTWALRYRNAWG